MIRRLLLLLSATGMLATALAVPAGAAATVSYTGAGSGWNDIYDPTGGGNPTAQAANYRFSVNGTTVTTYCADRSLALNSGASFTLAPASAAWAPRATYLAAHHDAIGTPLADANDEAAATQIAIWSLSNGDTISAGSVPDDAIRARATELAADGTSQAVPSAVEPTLSLTITGTAGAATAAATVSGVDTVSGLTVTFQTSAGTLSATTDGAGVASVALGTASGTVTAEVAVTIGAGTLLVPSDASQPQLVADPFTATASANATIQASIPTTTTVAPAPTTQLPYTGPASSPWLWVTGASLAGLAVVVLVRRRA